MWYHGVDAPPDREVTEAVRPSREVLEDAEGATEAEDWRFHSPLPREGDSQDEEGSNIEAASLTIFSPASAVGVGDG